MEKVTKANMLKTVEVKVEVVRNAGTRRARLVLEATVPVTPLTPGTTLRDCLAIACDQVRMLPQVRENDQLCAVAK